MGDMVIAGYAWLSGLAQGPILVIQDWIEGISVPLVSALLFGLIGATSPCQLTTNLGALAFSTSRAGRARVLGASLAYVAGKVLVYSAVGGLAVVLGLQLQGASLEFPERERVTRSAVRWVRAGVVMALGLAAHSPFERPNASHC